MCGLAGVLAPGATRDALSATASAMAQTLAHRGPDGDGLWVQAEQGIALAHRRLAILDLTPAGRQPMASTCGRYTLVFNGEIYNHLKLRTELGERAWKSGSDTETLLAGVERWGLVATLRRVRGMFALALWDATDQQLFLARDRMGEKPLYFGVQDGRLLFASELKAIAATPGVSLSIGREAVAQYACYGYVPAPLSIYQGFQKLRPGHIARFTPSSLDAAVEQVPYWRLEPSTPSCGRLTDAEAIEELHRRLAEAVRGQMLSDVPLGAFLSGGVDSSVVVALMQDAAARPVRTFSIGFDDPAFNEAPYASAVAGILGTDHTELIVTPEDSLRLIPTLSDVWDEPFADSSQVPTLLLSRLARSSVTVSLSGDGGDELFLGYEKYLLADRMQQMPRIALSAAAAAAGAAPLSLLNSAMPHAPRRLHRALSPERLAVLRQYSRADGPEARYLALFARSQHHAKMVSTPAEAPLLEPMDLPDTLDPLVALSAIDAHHYLPDDILVKVDRAAMAMSLETRAPLLDADVVQFAFSLPASMKLRGGATKWILKQVLGRYLPPAHVERPKMGFSVPLEHWLRGPLKPWAEELLDPDQLRRDGLFNPDEVWSRWLDHQAGRQNNDVPLWRVLMFQSWKQRWAP